MTGCLVAESESNTIIINISSCEEKIKREERIKRKKERKREKKEERERKRENERKKKRKERERMRGITNKYRNTLSAGSCIGTYVVFTTAERDRQTKT